jgi:hypothetical protein
MNMESLYQPLETVLGQMRLYIQYVHPLDFVKWIQFQFSLKQPNLEINDPVKPIHVLLIADPQIIDQYSYPSRGPLLSWLTRLVVDLNLRKNWHASLQHKPDAIVFLGDMMDNGRYIMSNEELVAVVCYKSLQNLSNLNQSFLDMKRTIRGSKTSSRKTKTYHSISYLETTT